MGRKDKPYLPLYVQDFLTDEKLMECSASATGIYIRIMCIMHKSTPYGTILLQQKDKQKVKQMSNQPANQIFYFATKLARHLPYDLEEICSGLNELLVENVLYVDGDLLIQKRMYSDGNLSAIRSETGQLGGIQAQKNRQNFGIAKQRANS